MIPFYTLHKIVKYICFYQKEKEKEKKKRKIRLEMHYDQVFLDGNDAYVWLYDPTPWYYYIAGAAIVLGIIAVCLFPLWPMEMRQGKD